MDEKELKRMSRANMLALLVQYKEELEEVKAKALGLEEQLNCRTIAMEESGSIAEASLKLNDVFTAAQKAADQYLESIQLKHASMEEEIRAKEEDAREKTAKLVADAQAQADEILSQAQQKQTDTEEACAKQLENTQAECEKLLADARTQADAYWESIYSRIQEVIDSHDYLKTMFQDTRLTRNAGTADSQPAEEVTDATHE